MKDDVFQEKDFKKCVKFHGHICPGISIGYKAALIGLQKLKEKKALDEELVAIVETDSCGVDAIQVLTGCTFGKGNFIYKDYGKMAFSFLSRKTNEGVRLCLLPNAFKSNPRHLELREKIVKKTANKKEMAEFKKLHIQKSKEILETADEKLFKIQELKEELPAMAKLEPSELCDICKESTMQSRLSKKDNKKICKSCLKK